MALGRLSERLGVPARTLYRWRRSFPSQVPKDFELESWREFIGKVRNYSAERTRPWDRNGTEPVPSSAKNGDTEFSALAERKERILRLRLGNDCRRTSLERLRESTVTMDECMETMARVRVVVGGEILKLPGSLAESLAGKDAAFIQMFLERAMHKCLQALSRPEIY
jgi:hypothetical protein